MELDVPVAQIPYNFPVMDQESDNRVVATTQTDATAFNTEGPLRTSTPIEQVPRHVSLEPVSKKAMTFHKMKQSGKRPKHDEDDPTRLSIPTARPEDRPEEVTKKVLQLNWFVSDPPGYSNPEHRYWANTRLFWLLQQIGCQLKAEDESPNYVSTTLPGLLDELAEGYNLRIPFILHHEGTFFLN